MQVILVTQADHAAFAEVNSCKNDKRCKRGTMKVRDVNSVQVQQPLSGETFDQGRPTFKAESVLAVSARHTQAFGR